MGRQYMTDYDKYWSENIAGVEVFEDGKVNNVDIVSIELGPDYKLPDTITISDSDNLKFDDLVVSTDNSYTYNWGVNIFQDYLPTVREIENMCEEYPALEKAYENFKTIYKMVEQDYKGKQQDDS
jgi:hypothetical protein